jgi:putative NADH-flavin reductase
VAAARALVAAAPKAGVRRIAWMGGGGSLAAPGGGRLVDQPGFPEQYRAEALAQAQALDLFRAAPSDVHWTYLSPPPENLEPGPARAGRRVQAGDEPVVDEHGHSRASSGDLAAAMIDELEQDHFARERFTVGD